MLWKPPSGTIANEVKAKLEKNNSLDDDFNESKKENSKSRFVVGFTSCLALGVYFRGVVFYIKKQALLYHKNKFHLNH